MKSPDAKFQSYLRREVETAGKRYEQAVEKVFALTGAPNIQGSDLMYAIQVVDQTLRLYTGSLHSLAAFAVRERQLRQPEAVESDAVEGSQEHLLVHA